MSRLKKICLNLWVCKNPMVVLRGLKQPCRLVISERLEKDIRDWIYPFNRLFRMSWAVQWLLPSIPSIKVLQGEDVSKVIFVHCWELREIEQVLRSIYIKLFNPGDFEIWKKKFPSDFFLQLWLLGLDPQKVFISDEQWTKQRGGGCSTCSYFVRWINTECTLGNLQPWQEAMLYCLTAGVTPSPYFVTCTRFILLL